MQRKKKKKRQDARLIRVELIKSSRKKIFVRIRRHFFVGKVKFTTHWRQCLGKVSEFQLHDLRKFSITFNLEILPVFDLLLCACVCLDFR